MEPMSARRRELLATQRVKQTAPPPSALRAAMAALPPAATPILSAPDPQFSSEASPSQHLRAAATEVQRVVSLWRAAFEGTDASKAAIAAIRLAQEPGVERARRQLSEIRSGKDASATLPWSLDTMPRLTPRLIVPGDVVRALEGTDRNGAGDAAGETPGQQAVADAELLLMLDATQLAVVLAEVDRMHRIAAMPAEEVRRFVNGRLRQAAVQLHTGIHGGSGAGSQLSDSTPAAVRVLVAAVHAAGGRVLEADDGTGRPSSPFLAALKRYHESGLSADGSSRGGSPAPPPTPTMKERGGQDSDVLRLAKDNVSVPEPPSSPTSSMGRSRGSRGGRSSRLSRSHKLSMMAGGTGRRSSQPRLHNIDAVVRAVQAVAKVWLWRRKTTASLSGWLLRGAPKLQPKRTTTPRMVGGTPSGDNATRSPARGRSSALSGRPRTVEGRGATSGRDEQSFQSVRPATAASPTGHDA